MQRNRVHRAEERVRKGKVSRHAPVACLAVALAMAACAANPTSSRSTVELVVERIEAPPAGATGDARRMFVESDVLTDGTVDQDTVQVTLRLVARDSSATVSPAAPTGAVFATIDRYRVRYVRTDGRNTPGIDVPHPWDGALSLAVSFDGETGDFVLVRASAKLEPPLVRLRDGGGDVVINTLAHITFYGRDHAGVRIEAAGAITVGFADWSDSGPME